MLGKKKKSVGGIKQNFAGQDLSRVEKKSPGFHIKNRPGFPWKGDKGPLKTGEKGGQKGRIRGYGA